MMPKNIRWEEDISESEERTGFFSNTIVRVLFVSALFPLLVLIGILGYFIRPTGNLIVLHYNVYFGVDVLGAWWQAYFPIGLSAMFLIGHAMLAAYFYEKSERVVSYLLLLSAGWLAIGSLIAGGSIAFINY